MSSAEYHRAYNRERYRRLRAEYVAQLGGKCVDCGTEEDLEFDHADASSKSVEVAKMLNYSKAVRDAEVKKCVLRCSSCHRRKSISAGDINSVDHGGGKSGKKNCPCTPCRERKAEYMRDYRRAIGSIPLGGSQHIGQ
jgi:hypothetical protein